jgi:hypothetical protein
VDLRGCVVLRHIPDADCHHCLRLLLFKFQLLESCAGA